MERNLNWKPSPPDDRDYKFSQNFSLMAEEELPSSANLNSWIPEVWDQLSLGSCVAFAAGMSVLYRSKKQNRPIDPSKLFLYYNVRKIEGTTNEDSGAYIRDAFKTLNKEGVCKTYSWPYIPFKFADTPPDNCYTEGLETLGTAYHSLNNSLLELKNCIVQGHPFVFGFNVYSSFMYGSWEDTMPIPKSNESILGGHAVIGVGYDDSRQSFLIKNSWGTAWKSGGHFWMPYSFIKSMECSDFWALESISGGGVPDPSNGCLDPFKLFLSYKELSTFSKAFLMRIAYQLGLEPTNVSKASLLSLLKSHLNLES